MSEPAPDKRREEARRALEGEEWQKKRAEKNKQLESRRAEARQAMEGESQKAKRLMEARAQAREEAATQKAAAEKEARLLAEKLKTEQAKEAAAQKAAADHARRQKITDTEQNIEKLKHEPAHLSALRTLKTDLAQAASSGISMSNVIIDRQRAQVLGGQSGSSAEPSKSRVLPWLILLLLLVVAGGSGAYFYFFHYQKPNQPPPPAVESRPASFQSSYLLSDEVVELQVENLDRDDLVGQLRRSTNDGLNTPDQIKLFPLLTGNREMTFTALLEKLGITPPESLKTGLRNSFILARYDEPGRNTVFLIFQTEDPEATQAGLKDWESDLPNLFYLLTGHDNFLTESSTTTISFASRLSHNLETRVWNNHLSNRDPDLLYAFLEPNTIALIESESALAEILSRRNNF